MVLDAAHERRVVGPAPAQKDLVDRRQVVANGVHDGDRDQLGEQGHEVLALRRGRHSEFGDLFTGAGEATLGKALDFVLAGPPEGAADGLDTSVPPGTRLRGVVVKNGLATIDLTGEINDIGGPAQKEAFAQIVFTALGFEEVQRVRFFIDGEPVDAPTDDGNLAQIDADNYDPPLNPR